MQIEHTEMGGMSCTHRAVTAACDPDPMRLTGQFSDSPYFERICTGIMTFSDFSESKTMLSPVNMPNIT